MVIEVTERAGNISSVDRFPHVPRVFQEQLHEVDRIGPSVDEIIDGIVAKILLRRPPNWQSLIRPELGRDTIPSSAWAKHREGPSALHNIRPARSKNLKDETASNVSECVHLKAVEGTAFRRIRLKHVSAKKAATRSTARESRQPHLSSDRNLKRVLESKSRSGSEKRFPVLVHAGSGDSTLKRKRGK